MPWYALYTKPRNEKKTALLLEDKGLTVYCPIHNVTKQWSDRKKIIAEPVFRSYIFVYLNDYNKENVTVLTTPGAVRFLWWLGKPGVVRDNEIENIRKFLTDHQSATAVPLRLSPDTRVSIKKGALTDYEGIVLREKKHQVEIVIESLGYKLVAYVDKDSVEIVA